MPKISVLMPVYNCEAYLKEAIDSILSQTLSDFELLILLECGTNQESKDIVYNYKDDRIKVIEKDTKPGIAESLNIGIRLSKGKYIARMDGDDISYPNRFALQYDYLEKHPEISICGSAMLVNGKSKVLLPRHPWEIRWNSFAGGVNFGHPTVMWRRRDFIDNELFYKTGYEAEDYELWLRVLDVLKGYNIPKSLLMYRQHCGNKSKLNVRQMNLECTEVLRKYWERNGLDYREFKGESLKSKILTMEYRYKEMRNKLPDFCGRDKKIRCDIASLYISYSMNLFSVYNRYMKVFESAYKANIIERLNCMVYFAYRIIRRRIRLLLDKVRGIER